jgi:hypothetical protein
VRGRRGTAARGREEEDFFYFGIFSPITNYDPVEEFHKSIRKLIFNMIFEVVLVGSTQRLACSMHHTYHVIRSDVIDETVMPTCLVRLLYKIGHQPFFLFLSIFLSSSSCLHIETSSFVILEFSLL